MRVAIAEDSTMLRELLAGKLISAGIEITAQSPNGADFLRLVETDLPEIAIIDIRLAGDIDGLDIAQAIRGKYPETGILILSQYSETAYVMRVAKLGNQRVGYLLKDNAGIHTLSPFHPGCSSPVTIW